MKARISRNFLYHVSEACKHLRKRVKSGLSMPPSSPVKLPAQLVSQLKDFRRRLRIVKILESVCLASIAILLSYILFYVSDRLWETPLSLGWILFTLALAALIILIPLWGVRWIWQRRTPAQLARLIAKKAPALGDRLLGVIELDSDDTEHQYSSEKLKSAAMEQVAREVAGQDLSGNIPKPRHKKLSILLGMMILGVIGLCMISPEAAGNALKRWINPVQPPDRYTFTQLEKTPSSLVIPLGESYIYDLHLSDSSKSRPESGQYSFRNGILQQSPLTDGVYKIHIPPLQEVDKITFRAGDIVHRIKIIPKARPSLLGATANVHYPSYMGRPDSKEAMRAGVISAPAGASLSLEVTASQPLASAADMKGAPLNIAGNKVMVPAVPLTNEPQELELTWTDTDGLATAQNIKIRFEPIEDKQPSLYLRGGENDKRILEDTSIELEVEAADDFGLKELGVTWQGEQSFYETPDTPPSSGPEENKKSQDAPRGEKILEQGSPTTATLKGTYLFQAKALKLSPQRVVIRGYTQDYNPKGTRVYSEPMIIYILSKAEHAQMIRNDLDAITNELEAIIRNMDAMTDEAKRLQNEDDLKKTESQQRLQALADEEEANRREVQELIHKSENLFKEASRNPQIDPEGMKDFMKGISMLKPIPNGSMKQAQTQFQESSSNKRSAAENKESLNQGEATHAQAAQQMKDAMNQLSKAAQNMEASTFVARLKQAAGKEDSIANALAGQIKTIIGLTMEELDPSTKREVETIATLQNDSAQDISWILEDLNYYKSRTDQRIYGDLYNQMNEFAIREKLDLVEGNILNAITAKSIDESRFYAKTLHHWAQLIDEHKQQQGGGGGDGAGEQEALSDAEFEFMLKIIRMIQQEQDIRMHTRAAEKEHRNQASAKSL